MDLLHVHLVLNHAPLFGSLVGAALLAAGMVRKSNDLKTAGLVALFFTGEPAEERVEHLPGVSHAAIERHEDAAVVALGAMLVVGGLALPGLIYSGWKGRIPASLSVIPLILSVLSIATVVWVANLGGQIRHTELAAGASPLVGDRD
jgi:fatty acid desaturase